MVTSRTQKESIVAGRGGMQKRGSKLSLRASLFGIVKPVILPLWSAHGLLVCKLLAICLWQEKDIINHVRQLCADINQLCHLEHLLGMLIYTHVAKAFSAMKEWEVLHCRPDVNFLPCCGPTLWAYDGANTEGFSVHVNVYLVVKELVGGCDVVIEFTFQDDFCDYRIECGVRRGRRRDESGPAV